MYGMDGMDGWKEHAGRVPGVVCRMASACELWYASIIVALVVVVVVAVFRCAVMLMIVAALWWRIARVRYGKYYGIRTLLRTRRLATHADEHLRDGYVVC